MKGKLTWVLQIRDRRFLVEAHSQEEAHAILSKHGIDSSAMDLNPISQVRPDFE